MKSNTTFERLLNTLDLYPRYFSYILDCDVGVLVTASDPDSNLNDGFNSYRIIFYNTTFDLHKSCDLHCVLYGWNLGEVKIYKYNRRVVTKFETKTNENDIASFKNINKWFNSFTSAIMNIDKTKNNVNINIL
jgi:hypothetical protein